MKYKVYELEGQTDIIFMANSDTEALVKADELSHEHDIEHTENGLPLIYRENPQAKQYPYGCGDTTCIKCNAWLEVLC